MGLKEHADAIMDVLYGADEFGHQTLGHTIVTDEERDKAEDHNHSLLYGEILPEGLRQVMDNERLQVSEAKVLYDLGMGVGKLVFRAFLEFHTLRKIVGVELAQSRYLVAEDKAMTLATLFPARFKILKYHPGEGIEIKDGRDRKLELVCGSILSQIDVIGKADAVLLNVKFPDDFHKPNYVEFFHAMKSGCRVLSYQRLDEIFPDMKAIVGLDVNNKDKVVLTSWAPTKGHKFWFWERVK